jgi:Cys-rich repeat protein
VRTYVTPHRQSATPVHTFGMNHNAASVHARSRQEASMWVRCVLAACVLISCNPFAPSATPCTRSSECGDNERCTDGACVVQEPECARDGDCDDGDFCENGECVECLDDRDCAAGEICDDNTCEPDEGGGEGEGEAPPPPPPDPEAPRFLDMSSNRTSMSQDDVLVISVVVTDPQGIDNVIGGTLLDPTSNATFGSFATSAAEGSYEIEVTWNEINEVRALTFSAPQQRTFRARFFDADGNESAQDIMVQMTCGQEPACNGFCASLECNDSCVSQLRDGTGSFGFCGACNQVCGDAGQCEGGTAASGFGASCVCEEVPAQVDSCDGQCTFLSDDGNCGTCGRFCELGACAFDSGYQLAGCACNESADCANDEACELENRTCLAASNLRLDASDRVVVRLGGRDRFVQGSLSNAVVAFLCPGVSPQNITSGFEDVPRPSVDTVGDIDCPDGFTSLHECTINNTFNFGERNARTVVCGAAEGEGEGEGPPPDSGLTQVNGYLEIVVDGTIGPICDDGFGAEEARVACRELGLPTANATFTSAITTNTGVFVMDEVNCTGSESSLLLCNSVGTSGEDCGTTEGIRVTCQ